MQILLFSHDRLAAALLSERLAQSGFAVTRTDRLDWAAENCRTPAAIIADVGTSEAAALQLVTSFRQAGFDQPLLVLSMRDDWQDRISSLDAGADDYLVKPTRSEEIAARMRAIIRRHGGTASNRLCIGEIELDLKGGQATLAGVPLNLTRNELRLLSFFLLRPRRLLTHDEIRERMYARSTGRSHNAVEVQIARLRRKIGADRIRTVRGMGYRFCPEAGNVEGEPDQVGTSIIVQSVPDLADHSATSGQDSPV